MNKTLVRSGYYSQIPPLEFYSAPRRVPMSARRPVLPGSPAHILYLKHQPLHFPHAVSKAATIINSAMQENRIADPAYFMGYMCLANRHIRKQLLDALQNGYSIA